MNLPTTTTTMASSTLIHPCSSHSVSPLSTISGTSLPFASLSTSPISYSKNPIFRSLTLVPQLGLASFSTWNGLRRNGFPISLKSLRFEKKRKYGGKGVFASLFGVGAPEALVIGVVALLVFGPKGLAEIAKNLGKTLRAFQPTIRELQDVSREFKSTLEKEIGLDELKSPAPLNTSSIPTLSSSPLSVAPPENSQATATELTIAATTTGSQETATPLAASTEDSQATPPAATTKDSQETTPPVAATAEYSQAVATSPAATSKDSQPTVSSVQEVGTAV